MYPAQARQIPCFCFRAPLPELYCPFPPASDNPRKRYIDSGFYNLVDTQRTFCCLFSNASCISLIVSFRCAVHIPAEIWKALTSFNLLHNKLNITAASFLVLQTSSKLLFSSKIPAANLLILRSPFRLYILTAPF